MRFGYVETATRVRWGECDGQGHAYYGSYIPWFDLGREAFALSVGVEFWKYKITTTDFQVRFRTPALYLDDLAIRTWALTPTARLDCFYEIYRKKGNQLIAEGRSSHALVDPAKGLRMRAPDVFHEKFEQFLATRSSAGPGQPHIFDPDDHPRPARV
jgi:acyl-CoA thioester hydrolase